jgi:hypothetical protein
MQVASLSPGLPILEECKGWAISRVGMPLQPPLRAPPIRRGGQRKAETTTVLHFPPSQVRKVFNDHPLASDSRDSGKRRTILTLKVAEAQVCGAYECVPACEAEYLVGLEWHSEEDPFCCHHFWSWVRQAAGRDVASYVSTSFRSYGASCVASWLTAVTS